MVHRDGFESLGFLRGQSCCIRRNRTDDGKAPNELSSRHLAALKILQQLRNRAFHIASPSILRGPVTHTATRYHFSTSIYSRTGGFVRTGHPEVVLPR